MSSETRTPVATPGGAAVTEETAGQSGSMRLRQQAARYIPFLALILLLVGFGIAESERFLTVRNAQIILLQSAVLIIVGLGMTFVIIAGSIDLSVGSLVAVAAMLSAAAANQWGPRRCPDGRAPCGSGGWTRQRSRFHRASGSLIHRHPRHALGRPRLYHHLLGRCAHPDSGRRAGVEPRDLAEHPSLSRLWRWWSARSSTG